MSERFVITKEHPVRVFDESKRLYVDGHQVNAYVRIGECVKHTLSIRGVNRQDALDITGKRALEIMGGE